MFDTTTLDESRVTSFLENHVTRRLNKEEYTFYNTENEIIPVEELSELVTRIDIDSVENSFKN